MIKYKVGDLVEALKSGEVTSIGHQANCFNTMNSGVAKAIRWAFPDAYQSDCLTEKGDKKKLGTFSLGVVDRGEELSTGLIYNLYGQYNYGYDAKGYTNYEALRGALLNMRKDLDSAVNFRKDLRKVGLPKIGAGLGGGDWDTIVRIIEEVFVDYYVTIYVLRESDVPERSEV